MQAPGRVGVRMRDAEGYQYYSCSECVEMVRRCAVRWMTCESAGLVGRIEEWLMCALLFVLAVCVHMEEPAQHQSSQSS